MVVKDKVLSRQKGHGGVGARPGGGPRGGALAGRPPQFSPEMQETLEVLREMVGWLEVVHEDLELVREALRGDGWV